MMVILHMTMKGMMHKNNEQISLTPSQSIAPFHLMAKPIGPQCNLNCAYCFYLEKDQLYPDRAAQQPAAWRMDDATLERFIERYIASQQTPDITFAFAWQGGEPTMLGVDYFRKVVALQQKYAHGKKDS